MVRLRRLGELRLEVDGEPVALPSSRKARLLLALLALEPRRHGRSELAGRLWPDSSRRALGRACATPSRSCAAPSGRTRTPW